MSKPPGFDRKTGAMIIANTIPGFPYPVRSCPFCERELVIVNAAHDLDEQLFYKAIMLCENSDCPAFDREQRAAYVRAYYSCEEARKLFEDVMLPFRIEIKE